MASCMARHQKLKHELFKRNAKMDSLRYMLNKDMQKREEDTQAEIDRTEAKLLAANAVKKAMEKQKRIEKHQE